MWSRVQNRLGWMRRLVFNHERCMQVSGKRSLGGSWDGPLYSAHDCDHCRGRSPTTMTTISTLHRWLVNHVLHHTHHLVYAKAGTAALATRIHLIIMSGVLFTLKWVCDQVHVDPHLCQCAVYYSDFFKLSAMSS